MCHFIKIRLGILYDILVIPKSRIWSMAVGEWLSELSGSLIEAPLFIQIQHTKERYIKMVQVQYLAK
jgi:integral membrane sensor domain MASE1